MTASIRKTLVAFTALGAVAAASPAFAASQFSEGHYLLDLVVTPDNTCSQFAAGTPLAFVFVYPGPSSSGAQARSDANSFTPATSTTSASSVQAILASRFQTETPASGSATWKGTLTETATVVGQTPASASDIPFEFDFVFVDGNSFMGTFSVDQVDATSNMVCKLVTQVTALRLAS